ncbi:CocE/NonD family hydrolase [Subtercola lobariae]|uniref:Hydrolase n=1 Tax=Subtercola lobariae TaxID=1588641 RepID=A0A917EXC8_9MICO|nr:CocE/NonD family hydrolase [Subtercola lobariae]GGF30665.1 hydrolase [Subtercola lobariae]
MKIEASGIEQGQRQLNGPQTTGREYRNLSEVRYAMHRENNVSVPMRDGTILLVDVLRPTTAGAFPALLAAAPYPRQMQDIGAPAGVIEAGMSDFWVPRGYVHVIANLRGTGGSGGTWGFFDRNEREDLYDLVEWMAEQHWSDGNVGMIGISYYAMTQLEAATQRPPHLKAIFPFDVTVQAWEAANHNGLFSSAFITPWISALGVLSGIRDRRYRRGVSRVARRVLAVPSIHRRFARTSGGNALTGLRLISRFRRAREPWNSLWLNIAVEHPTRDAWWNDRDLTSLLAEVEIPTYIGSEWSNVPLHLAGAFAAWQGLAHNPNVRMSILGEGGLPWPWESMHIEALAWFDHWLKGRDTGTLAGPAIRYWMPGAEEWRTSDVWPPAADVLEFGLGADGVLAQQPAEGAASRPYGNPMATPVTALAAQPAESSRSYLCLAPATSTSQDAGAAELPDAVSYMTEALPEALDVVGHLELELHASATAADTAWVVQVHDVAPDGSATAVTQGWLRASMREVDEQLSSPGLPVLPMRTAVAVPVGEKVAYRVPIVATARRFETGHRIRLTLSSDDTHREVMQNFTHTPVGTSSVNTIFESSRLLIPRLLEADTVSRAQERPAR